MPRAPAGVGGVALGVFVREPVPGRVKRRLAREVGEGRACDLYEGFVHATLRLAGRAGLAWRVFYTRAGVGDAGTWGAGGADPAGAERRLRLRFGIRGVMSRQRGRTLGARMRWAFAEMLAESPSVILIGSDSPTLPAGFIRRAAARLRDHDLVLGPAEDGGYYLIGLTRAGFRKAGRDLFYRIRWGGPTVFRMTLERAIRRRIRAAILDPWYDIDTLKDLRRAGFC